MTDDFVQVTVFGHDTNIVTVFLTLKTTSIYIYILSVVALDETTISSCYHFWMQNIEMAFDLDRTSRLSYVNVSEKFSLFIEVYVTSFTYMYPLDVLFTRFAPWLFQHLSYKSNISFYKDNYWSWMEDN